MKALPFLLLALWGCSATPADRVLLDGAPMETVPDAWILWGPGEPEPKRGVLISRDGQVEAVVPSLRSFSASMERRSMRLDAADLAHLEQALAVPPAAPAPRQKPQGGFEPETEPPDEAVSWTAVVRGADGSVRRISYKAMGHGPRESGGEPLHPLLRRILREVSK